jgi:hypothetical protein
LSFNVFLIFSFLCVSSLDCILFYSSTYTTYNFSSNLFFSANC